MRHSFTLREVCCGLTCLVLLAGCRSNQEADSWFPLESGREWHYQQTREWGQERTVSRYEVRNLEPQIVPSLGDDYKDRMVFIRRTLNGTDYYIDRSEQGIQRVGKRVLIETYPQVDAFPRTIIPNSESFEDGLSWEVETQPYVLASTASHIPWNPATHRLNMLFEIVDMDSEIETPAGVFKHCLKIQGQAKISVYADPRLGYQDVQIKQTEWYAKGVGLVKLVRDEPLSLEMYQGGSITLDLISTQ